MRETLLFDENWRFHKGDIPVPDVPQKGPMYIQSKTERKLMGPAAVQYLADGNSTSAKKGVDPTRWDTVNLPHDYIIGQIPEERYNSALGYFKYKNAWYRKKFALSPDDKDKRICLLFEGVATTATVYLNGCLMGHNFCGYTSFEIDISDYVEFEKENVLAVYVDATSSHEGWWYEGAGIYRHVWMIKTEKVSVDLWGLYVRPEYKDGSWNLHVENTIRNDSYSEVEADITTEIIDEENVVTTLSGKCRIAAAGKNELQLDAPFENPTLWDLDNPHMYKAVTRVYVNGQNLDSLETKFGFRFFSYNPDEGFTVNGKKTFINGVCGHQDFGLTGKAVPDNILKHKVKLIKEMGANGFRCSHYPHPVAEMDAFDELGLIVMAETRWFESTDEGLAQLEMLVKRDRNRPSVFFWSVGNEEPKFATETGRRICRRMIEKIRQLDNSRMITAAVSHSPDVSTVYEDLDVIGINYNTPKYAAIHEKYPDKMIIASECDAAPTTRGWYYGDDAARGYYNAIDKDSFTWSLGRENTWKSFRDNPYICGAYQWDAFEHRGECDWPRLCSQCGAIDMFLQKKDAFYQNQSLFLADKPVIHVLPHWNFKGMEGEIIRVAAYTNCDEAELFLNGKSFGRLKIDKPGHAEWSVPYEQGSIRAVGYNASKAVAEDAQSTTGAPVRLLLKLENEIKEANGKDVALVSCYCVDEAGREVPDASPFVRFMTNSLGKIIGTGSDVCDHNSVKEPERRMRAGRISVALAVGKVSGMLKLYAEAEGLLPAVLSIELE